MGMGSGSLCLSLSQLSQVAGAGRYQASPPHTAGSRLLLGAGCLLVLLTECPPFVALPKWLLGFRAVGRLPRSVAVHRSGDIVSGQAGRPRSPSCLQVQVNPFTTALPLCGCFPHTVPHFSWPHYYLHPLVRSSTVSSSYSVLCPPPRFSCSALTYPYRRPYNLQKQPCAFSGETESEKDTAAWLFALVF